MLFIIYKQIFNATFKGLKTTFTNVWKLFVTFLSLNTHSFAFVQQIIHQRKRQW